MMDNCLLSRRCPAPKLQLRGLPWQHQRQGSGMHCLTAASPSHRCERKGERTASLLVSATSAATRNQPATTPRPSPYRPHARLLRSRLARAHQRSPHAQAPAADAGAPAFLAACFCTRAPLSSSLQCRTAPTASATWLRSATSPMASRASTSRAAWLRGCWLAPHELRSPAHAPTTGSCCTQCGKVLDDTVFSTDATFSKGPGGASQARRGAAQCDARGGRVA
jgi:hypothetical protein